ncbi:HlyD family type I secretion periplasmic adaptor subunit [Ramlibacter sp. AW1]|uniref:Membrane fusion protein (MFP) family protein n=1 Tax=Ramlibacter aurantiacus TaxID=2801330 RepID=A0A937D7K4_9BURK|nr:HlyD family type I secretion periplasmic adaptor subunit [Ramlibacter aurantiacus]MBL0423412.1 HlyD family type I secretion periplasmic adaptor subunit [Ramlibacter aurantiacus]
MSENAQAPSGEAPDLLALQEEAPARMPAWVGYAVGTLVLLLFAWAAFGQLDIVATAEGRLVPRNHSRVVQPAEAGVVHEVLVREGDAVHAGQVLMRMDGTLSRTELDVLQAESALREASLRRIDAELRDQPLLPQQGEPVEVSAQVGAQYRARRQAYIDAVSQEEAQVQRTRHELAAAREQLAKLQATLPLVKRAAQAYEQLVGEGFVSELGAHDRLRERIAAERDMQGQQAMVAGLLASLEQSGHRLAQIRSSYESQLLEQRMGLLSERQRSQGELRKQGYRSGLLELRAAEDGTVTDLVTYTPGAVVQPGVVLMNLVPRHEPLFAEVAVRNEDVGFVAPGQLARVKLLAYPFQKYGLLTGRVELLSADSGAGDPQRAATQGRSPHSYRALVRLDTQQLRGLAGEVLSLAPGMMVQAEIHQGRRTVLEYLLSPVRRLANEAARER